MNLFQAAAGATLVATSVVGGLRLEVITSLLGKNHPGEFEFHMSEEDGFTPGSSSIVAVGAQRTVEVTTKKPGVVQFARVVPRIRNASRIARAQPSVQISCPAGRASAAHILSRLDTSRKPLNGGFETQVDPAGLPDYWLKDGDGVLTVMTDGGGISGGRYMKMVNTYGQSLYLYSAVTDVAEGESYKLSTKHKEATGPTAYAVAVKWYDYTAAEDDPSTGYISNNTSNISNSASWAKYTSGAFTAPANARFARVYIAFGGAGSWTVYIDEVRLTEQ